MSDDKTIKLKYAFEEEIHGLKKGIIYNAVRCRNKLNGKEMVEIKNIDGDSKEYKYPFAWFDLVKNYAYYIDDKNPFDSLILYKTQFKKIKLVDKDNNEFIGTVDLYESEWDSGDDVAGIGLSNGWYYRQNDINYIEILADNE
ncbi:hypothetical protein [Ruminococcus sp.]|uniref:hypothetical protein n=1 Tax=Ruminococcus sp. TaxID=41978 RepID=UPI0025F888AA|nr:hypothetical protein [Ruminococcus sp.]